MLNSSFSFSSITLEFFIASHLRARIIIASKRLDGVLRRFYFFFRNSHCERPVDSTRVSNPRSLKMPLHFMERCIKKKKKKFRLRALGFVRENRCNYCDNREEIAGEHVLKLHIFLIQPRPRRFAFRFSNIVWPLSHHQHTTHGIIWASFRSIYVRFVKEFLLFYNNCSYMHNVNSH